MIIALIRGVPGLILATNLLIRSQTPAPSVVEGLHPWSYGGV